MKRFYKLRKRIVERLGGTMEPIAIQPVCNTATWHKETYCATHTERVSGVIAPDYEQFLTRHLVHKVADMIYEKHAYRASVEQPSHDDYAAITVCVDVAMI